MYLPRKNIASDEFISLDAPCEADAKDEGGGKDAKDEEVVIPSHLLGPRNMDLEEGQVEDMDLADDDVVVGKDQLLDASIQPEISVAAVQTVIGFEVKLDKGDGTENAPIFESNSISVEESRILLNGLLCISANILLQLQVPMFSEDLFVSIESWELYLHKKRRLLVILLGPYACYCDLGQIYSCCCSLIWHF